jgi:hypothetical protein
MPATGSHTFKFVIYSAAGTQVWSQTSTVTVNDGFFATTLDGTATGNTFPAGMFDGSELLLGLTVDSDAEMTPRQPLDSVPYAVVAGNAIGDLTPHSVSVAGSPVIDSTGAWVGKTIPGTTVSIQQTFKDPLPGVNVPAALTGRVSICTLPPYTPTTANQVAIVSVTGTCSVPAGDGLSALAAANDVPFANMNNLQSNPTTGSLWISLGQTMSMPLTQGTAYTFETSLANPLNANAFTAACTCSTVAQIVQM